MEETEQSCCSAGMHKAAMLLQEKWVLLIVSRLVHGPTGFNELSRKADGVNPTTMAQRLTLLEHTGLVTKTIHSTMPPRTSYELTEAGHALRPILEAMEAWGAKYLADQPAECPLLSEEA